MEHKGAAAVNEDELVTLVILHHVLDIVLRQVNDRFFCGPVGGYLVEVCPTSVRPCIVDGLAVISPEDLAHPFVRGGVEFLKELALGVGDVQSSPYN